MAKRAVLDQFIRRLQQAMQQGDWTQLARIDRELAVLLPLWQKQDERWSEEERRALQSLRLVFESARQYCGEELDRLDQRLRGMREQRAGWVAYAAVAGTNWNDSLITGAGA